MKLFFLICFLPTVAFAYPRIPYTVRDACTHQASLIIMTDDEVLALAEENDHWQITPILKRGTEEQFWRLDCAPFTDIGSQVVVSRLRAGNWRSVILGEEGGSWKVIRDNLPFALRHVVWEGTPIWIGMSAFPQIPARVFEIESMHLGKRIMLPMGASLDNWQILSDGRMAVLRERAVFFLKKDSRGKWRQESRLPAAGESSLCVGSGPAMMSSTGSTACRLLAPLEIPPITMVADNRSMLADVVGREPVIGSSTLLGSSWSGTIQTDQQIWKQGPYPGEIAAYFIDNRSQTGGKTPLAIVQVRTTADAVGGITQYSIVVPIDIPTTGTAVGVVRGSGKTLP